MNSTPPSALVTSDDDGLAALIRDELDRRGYATTTARTAAEALRRVAARPAALVVAHGGEALAAIRAVRAEHPAMPTVVQLVVPERSREWLGAASAAGADGCLVSPRVDPATFAVELDLLARAVVARATDGDKSAFVAVMSHELRTPLAAVLGMLDLLADTPDVPAHALDLVHAADRNAHKLLDLVNDLLDVWAVDTGTLALRVDTVDVRDVLAEATATATPRAREKGLQLELALPATLPAVTADPHRLRHVLRHLLDNAIKFTDAGHVRVSTEIDAASLRLVVRDTGIGIHPDDHERIFDAFVQADGSATRRHGGAGLGLAICRRLATLMRGTIGLHSTPGEGSAFWVALPCATIPTDGA